MLQPVRRRCLLCAAAILVGGTLPVATKPEAPTQVRAADLYGGLPLSCEANDGQLDRAVLFLCRGRGSALFLTSSEAVLALGGAGHEGSVVRFEVPGGNLHPRVVGERLLPTKSNYLLGPDPHQWRTNVPSYAQVRYHGVYPGVDLVFHGNRRQLEYDFVLAPGADPGWIRLGVRGADAITIGAEGELVLHTPSGELVQHAPEVYQEAWGRRQRVEGHYLLLAGPPGTDVASGGGTLREVGFAVGRYDRDWPLIIDPVLVYSTFLGGSGTDAGEDVAVDGAGNVYVTGYTSSAAFPGASSSSIQPANGGGNDAFVTKINATGSAIVYSTFLGGGGDDQGSGIAVDGAGNAYVTGQTTSTSFPGVGGGSIQPASSAEGDAFVAKLNAAGSAIVYATFLGGNGSDFGSAIAVDGTGNAYVTGYTNSGDFPGVNGSSLQPHFGGGRLDAFVTKINATGTAIVYSTFLGGSGDDRAQGIAVDGAGNAYVAGRTSSTTFPGVSGSSLQPVNGGGPDNVDGFVTKINATGTAIVYSTFLGGTANDIALGIAVDGAGNAYVTGATDSANFPGVSGSSIQPVNGGGGDAFVTKIDAIGKAIVYSTYLGGSGTDAGQGIAVDGAGNAYVTGLAASDTFPGVDGGSIQPVNGRNDDGFVTKINAAGTAIIYSTFLGGHDADLGNRIAVDGVGNAYVTGFTASTTFPGVSGSSLQAANGGGVDAFVAKIGEMGFSLQMSASAAGFVIGVPASYTLKVTYTATAPTTVAATITDPVPALLTLGTLPAGCSASGQTVTCTVPANLAVGQAVSFVIPVTPQAGASGTSQTNTATVSGGGDPGCPAAARCTGSVTTPVTAPRLSAQKSASAVSFDVGVAASYTLQVTNTGTAATTVAATITDSVPPILTLGTLPAGCSASGHAVTCAVPANLAVGQAVSFVIPVTPQADSTGTFQTNTVTISGGGDPGCPAAAHCTGSVTTPVTGPRLAAEQSASAASFEVGVQASYALQVTNAGTTATVAAVTVTDQLPALVVLGTLPAGCSAVGQTVTCTLSANLAAGQAASFVLPILPQAGAAGTNLSNSMMASGGGDPSCPAAAHCSSTISTPVAPAAPVSIPALSSLMLGVLAFLLAGAGALAARRRA